MRALEVTTPPETFARHALRLLWFVVIPALGAALFVRYALPSPWDESVGTLGRALGAFACGSPFAAGALVFLVLATVIRYWSSALPLTRFLMASARPARAWKSPAALKIAAAWAVAIILVLVGRARCFQTYEVLGASMMPSLVPGELAVANRLEYRPLFAAPKPPKRGDIVVFRQSNQQADELVKRVIGLPSDRISVEDGLPTINGWRVPHCDAGLYADLVPSGQVRGRLMIEFLGEAAYLIVQSAGGGAPEYAVPPGQVYVLGDHRSGSLDSRYFDQQRPAALPMPDLDGRITRTLTLPRRDGTPSFSAFLKPIALDLYQPSLNTSDLTAGIERCLRHRPSVTNPPAR